MPDRSIPDEMKPFLSLNTFASFLSFFASLSLSLLPPAEEAAAAGEDAAAATAAADAGAPPPNTGAALGSVRLPGTSFAVSLLLRAVRTLDALCVVHLPAIE